MNAGHELQWTFCPADVAALLERPVVNSVVFDPMESELFPPSRDALPETVLAALRSLYTRHRGIRAAYVLVARSKAAGSADQPLVVIEMDVAIGGSAELLEMAGCFLGGAATLGETDESRSWPLTGA